MRVDAHQHFWRYTSQEFGWIDDGMAVIRRDFLPGDLAPLLRDAGMDATVAVQARQSLEETHWLLKLARDNDWIAGVVGWVPLTDPAIEGMLQRLAQNPKLRGVRHVLQGESDAYMAREDFNAGVARLSQFHLTYDLLVLERQLPAAIAFVDRHPQQPIVLDHLAKPLIAALQLEPWRTNIRELARRPNVSCKLSGMVTEADHSHWTIDHLRPYVETVLDAFGPDRVIFGSDWPVCTVASGYARWVATVSELLCELSSSERNAVLGGNATRFYRLGLPGHSFEVKST
jgi:L-fuconolactonase